MEHIADFVCFAPMMQILETVEQLQDVLQFFDRLSKVPEPVIEVPKIFAEDVPLRAVLRDMQLAEQLVEVPTIASNSLFLLLQAILQHKALQRTVEQNVDVPAVGGSGAGAGLSGFLAGQNNSMTVEQIVDNPVPGPGGAGDLQQRFRSRSPGFPIQVEVVQIFSQSRAPQRLLQLLLDTLIMLPGKSAKIPRTQGSEVGAQSSSWTP